MKNVEKMMKKLNKKRSEKKENGNRPAEDATRFTPSQEVSDKEKEIEKAFIEYLKDNNEVPDDTLMRYIAQITR